MNFQPWRRSAALVLSTIGTCLLVGSSVAVLPESLRFFADTPFLGGADRNLITGGEASPKVTQSTSAVWGHGNTVVAVYEDSSGSALNPASYCGVSTSTDGGVSFTRLPYKFNTGGLCNGQPSVFYSMRAAKWSASFGAGRCGGNGVGLWESLDGISWGNGSCIHSGNNTDFRSIWVDNNPASPFYGTQYAAFNDFDLAGGAPRVARSTDDGVTWSAPVTLFGGFRRALKITGSLGADGTIFVQTIAEGGGGLNGPRQNFIHRSTDGGITWGAPIAQGASFLGPGRSVNGYFAGMYSTPVAGYWIDMGWGEPAVGPNGVIHYAYSSRPGTGDPGDVFYLRSTDNGATWSAPLKLNTDVTTRAQWSPSLSANAQGQVFVSWYDERNTTTDALERFGRASLDNGATWGTEMALSDGIFPKPLQPDPSFAAPRVGLYNRTAFSNNGNGQTAYHAWTDGRVSINSQPQQDVFFDRISFLPPLFVTTVDDHDDGTCAPADCTLREAINAANVGTAAVIINFAPGVTGIIQLASALPQLANDIALRGPGAGLLTVRRNSGGDYRVLTVSNNTINGPTVTISGLTITNGRAGTDGGGGISNRAGNLTISDCVITGNNSSSFPAAGGGIHNFQGTLSVNNSTVSGNIAFSGGGIASYRNVPGTSSVTVTNTTVSGNTASGGDGGGILNNAAEPGSAAAFTLTNCTISGNQTSGVFGGNGGGVRNISQNSGSATATLTNCTLSNNSASVSGSSISNLAAQVTLRNNILQSASANLANSSGGTITSQGHNLSNDNGSGFLTGTADQINTDPQLDSAGLANNGGPTMTLALMSGSPAINSGNDAAAPPRDQRNYARNGISDKGAFEFNGIAPVPPAVVSVVSRKVHGASGTFDITLPAGVECRTGGAGGIHQVVVTFANPVTVGGVAITSSNGMATSTQTTNGAVVTIDLAAVANAQTANITLTNVSDGTNVGDVAIPFRVLAGDSTNNGSVTASDVGQVKGQSGQPVTGTNFRTDVTANGGSVTSSDVGLVKSVSGTQLP